MDPRPVSSCEWRRLCGCPGWSESSLGPQVILLVLSCGSYVYVVYELRFGQFSIKMTSQTAKKKANLEAKKKSNINIELGFQHIWYSNCMQNIKCCWRLGLSFESHKGSQNGHSCQNQLRVGYVQKWFTTEQNIFNDQKFSEISSVFCSIFGLYFSYLTSPNKRFCCKKRIYGHKIYTFVNPTI